MRASIIIVFLVSIVAGEKWIQGNAPRPRLYPMVTSEFFPTLAKGQNYLTGQDVRVKLTMWSRATNPYSPAFNTSTERFGIQVIAAYPNRASSGRMVTCNSTLSDAWFTSSDVGARVFKYGGEMASQAYATFSAPPFPFRVCMRNVFNSSLGVSFVEVPDQYLRVHHTNTSGMFWDAPENLHEGDFASVRVLITDTAWDYRQWYGPSAMPLLGDTVKLVPAGSPCSYEKKSSRDGQGLYSHFCGSRSLSPNGAWATERCAFEGSVVNGVARVGTNSINPLVESVSDGGAIISPAKQIAFFRLPSAGSYDVCYSSYEFRRIAVNATESVPLWIKLFKAGTGGCSRTSYTSDRTCTPAISRLTVTAETTPLKFSLFDATEHTWGTVKITSSTSSLSTMKATSWDCKGCTKEYFETTGGDAFRFIPASAVSDGSLTAGELSGKTALGNMRYEVSAPSSTYGSNGERTTIRFAGYPNAGTQILAAGCWSNSLEAFGYRGATINGAVDTSSGDTGYNGVTSSGDLGGNPRTGDTAYLQDKTSQSEAYAYVRIPSAARSYYVCYRMAGRQSWRIIQATTGGHVFNPIVSTGSHFGNVSFSINDTRAGTWGEFHVHSNYIDLHTLPSTYYNTQEDAFGFSMKLVLASHSCDTDQPTIGGISHDAGGSECPMGVVAACTAGTCGCEGSGLSIIDRMRRISFYLLVPEYGSSYRVCLRNSTFNWHQVGTVTPTRSPRLQLVLYDHRAGTWGALRVKQYVRNTRFSVLDSRASNGFGIGDTMRLIPNATNGRQSFQCDVNTVDRSPNRFIRDLSSWDLGVWCGNSTTFDQNNAVCQDSRLTPKEPNSEVSGTYPYDDVDSTANAVLDAPLGTVGFMTLPLASHSYVLCYKQAHMNWVVVSEHDVQAFIPIIAQSAVIVAQPTQKWAGSFVAFGLKGTGSYKFNPSTSVFKLVPDTVNCDRPAAGAQQRHKRYISSTYPNRNNAFTDENGNMGIATDISSGRAYIVLPTTGSSESGATRYKMCFIDQLSTKRNWHMLGTIDVVSLGLVYTVESQPMHMNTISVHVLSDGTNMLNTSYLGDAIKLVDHSSACLDDMADDVPLLSGKRTGWTHSRHIGLELSPEVTEENEGWTAVAQNSGIVDLGPGDAIRAINAQASFTLPSKVESLYCYTVCYRRQGMPWVILEHAPMAKQRYALSKDGFCASASDVSAVNVHTNLTSRSSINGRRSPVTPLLGGAATLIPADTRHLHLIRPGKLPTSNLNLLTTTASAASTLDEFKLVLISTYKVGWVDVVPQPDCTSPAYETYSVSPSGTGTPTNLVLDMPLVTARFLMCYRRTGHRSWIQLAVKYVDTSDVKYATSTSSLQLTDYYHGYVGTSELSFASLSYYDLIYFVNATGVCGVTNAYLSYATTTDYEIQYYSVALNGTGNITEYAVSLSTKSMPHSNLSTRVIFPISEVYTAGMKLCYFKQVNHERVNGTTSVTPKLRGGQWYHIPTSSNAPLYYAVAPTKTLTAVCPPYNLTDPARAGRFFNVRVTANYDPSPSDEILAVTNGFEIQSAGGSCGASSASFLWPSDETRQHFVQRVFTGRYAAFGSCPDGICSLTFTSGAVTSNTCQFRIHATSTSELRVVEKTPVCELNEMNSAATCIARLVAVAHDKDVDYISNEAVTTTLPKLAGVTLSASDYTSGKFVRGYYQKTFTAKLDASTVDSWLEGVDHTANVMFTVREGTVKVNVTFVIPRPTLHTFRIRDLRTDALLPNTNNLDHLQVGKWEADGTFSSHWDPLTLPQSVVAVKHYLIAQHPYTAYLEPVDEKGRTLPHPKLVKSSERLITIAPFSDGNTILDGTNSEVSPFTTTELTSIPQAVSFRLKNTLGCRKTDGGCKLVFKFGGADKNGETSIKTYVRGVASSLKAQCGAGGQNVADSTTLAVFNTCPDSAVEKGYTVVIEAVDQFGQRDEFFEGDVVPVPRRAGSPAVTTLLMLSAGNMVPVASKKAVDGVTSWNDISLTLPCTHCRVDFVSNWGANMTSLYFTTKASTTQLKCSIATPLYLVTTGNTPTVSGTLDATATAQYGNALIYPDKEICFTVWAANVDGAATLYETNWIAMTTRWTNGAGTLRESTTTPGRVKPLIRSSAKFCFFATLASGVSSADLAIEFSAQKFGLDSNGATYWSKSSGVCSLATFHIRANKFIGQIQIPKVTGLTDLVEAPTSLSNVWYYSQMQKADETSTVAVTLSVADHYGTAISSYDDLVASQRSFYIMPDECSAANLRTKTCAPGSGAASSSSTLTVTPRYPIEEGGALSVAVQTSALHVANLTTGPLSITYTVSKFCLHCTLGFRLRTGGETDGTFTDGISGTVSAQLVMSVLLPRAGISRFVAFKYLKSPLTPVGSGDLGLTKSVWPRHVYTNSTPNGWSFPSTSPTLIHQNCHVSNLVCYPTETSFLNAECDGARSPTTIQNGNENIQVYTYASISDAATSLSYGAPTCRSASDVCTNSSNVMGQIDILGQYTYNIRIGTQILKCVGGTCMNDLTTNPQVAGPVYGSTIPTALKKLVSGGITTASFALQGVRPSSYAISRAATAPDMRGAFVVNGVSNETSDVITTLTTSPYEFVWRQPEAVASFRVVDMASDVQCQDAPTYKYFSYGTSAYDGYFAQKPLQSIRFNYTKDAFLINQAIPFTFEVQTTLSHRALNADGSVSIELMSTSGCNNGGSMSVTPSASQNIKDGRVTFWVRFSAPCERCVIRATLTPSSAAIYDGFRTNIAAHVVSTKPIVVVNNLVHGATAVHCLDDVTAVPNSLTVQQTISTSFQTYTNVSGLLMENRNPTGKMFAYNKVSSPVPFFGNGGVLRSATTLVMADRHGVTSNIRTGRATLTFAFQRLCTNCQVVIVWTLSSGERSSFHLQNKAGTRFQVTGENTRRIFTGFLPRVVRKENSFALSVWHVSTDDVLGVVGVSSNTLGNAVPVFSVKANNNGDGGDLSANTVPFRGNSLNTFEQWVMSLSSSCSVCTLTVGATSYDVKVTTDATQLRVVSISPQLADPSSYINVNLAAVDELGFVDQSAGGVTDCAFNLPFLCPTSGQPVSVRLTSNGETNAFTPSSLQLQTSGGSKLQLTTNETLRIFDGLSAAHTPTQIMFNLPVRRGVPIFQYTSPAHGGVVRSEMSPRAIINVDVGLGNISLSVEKSAYTVSVGRPFRVFFGYTKPYRPLLADDHFVAIAVKGAIVNVTFVNCPLPNSTSPHLSVPVEDGLANVSAVFVSASSTCRIRLLSTSATHCPSCVVEVPVTVQSIVATRWNWLTPTANDNLGAGVGPRFGAMGRSMVLRAQLYATDADGVDVPASSCGDVTCRLVVRSSACSPSPTISPDAGAAFDSNGVAEVSVEWQKSTDERAYTCTLSMNVVGATLTGPPTGTAGSQPVVSVCSPFATKLLTNVTSDPAYIGDTLITGRSYPFQLMTVDKYGAFCPGDSQNTSTVVKVDLVRETSRATKVVGLVNLNRTGSLEKNGLSVRMVGGMYKFDFHFTESTRALQIPYVRLRMNSSLTSGSMLSDVIETSILGSRLRFFPEAPVARGNFVTGRPFVVNVQAVDAVDPEWGYQPNVAKRADDPASKATVAWFMDDVVAQVFPFRFNRGQRISSLSGGEYAFNMTYTGKDREVEFGVRDDNRKLVAPKPFHTVFQSIVGLKITVNMTETNVTSNQGFTVFVDVIDAQGRRVLGDNESVVSLHLVKKPLSKATVSLRMGPVFVDEAPFQVKVTQGRATVELGFVGTTNEPGQSFNHSLVAIQARGVFTAPAVVSPVTTSEYRVTQSAGSGGGAADVPKPTVRIPLSLVSLSLFNVTSFRTKIVQLMQEYNAGVVTSENAGATIEIVACEVQTDMPSIILTGKVCGITKKCSTAGLECPLGVIRCICSDNAAAASAKRLNNVFHALATTFVQTEVTFNVQQVPGMETATAAQVNDAYNRVTSTLISGVTESPLFTNFSVNATGVGQVAGAATPVPTPSTTLVPPSNTTPVPPIVVTPSATPVVAGAYRLITGIVSTTICIVLFTMCIVLL
eukprot:PhM_4_TR1273/c0_g1_i1/m.87279